MIKLIYPTCRTSTTISGDKKVSISIMNSQSIKNTEDQILHHLMDRKANLAVITETWLRDNDTDKIWIEACELKNGYKLQVQNRGEGRGGGIGAVYRDNITVNKVDRGRHPSFEYAVWSVKFTTVHLILITIYHPPCTTQNSTDNQFIEWLSENLATLPNVVITGDFNIHVNLKIWITMLIFSQTHLKH